VAPLEVQDFPGSVDGHPLLPPETGSDIQFFKRLGSGFLQFPACDECHRARFPVAPVCPYCGSSSFQWVKAHPSGRIHSWVRYHRAYLPEFEQLVPYVVLAVEMDDGPILFGRLTSDSSEDPVIGHRVDLVVEKWKDDALTPSFRIREEAQ
jgi:uncharacterized OB-fold protein